MTSFLRRHYLLSTAVSLQLVALLIGLIIFYTCRIQGGLPPLTFSEIVWWGTIGILRLAFFGIAIPLTAIVIAAMLILIMCSASWKKVRFLSPLAFVIWGAYWVFVAHIICSPPPD